MDQLEAKVASLTKSQQGTGKMRGEKPNISSPRHVDPLTATDARRDTWTEDVWLPDPCKAEQPRKREALCVAGQYQRAWQRGMSHDTFAPSTNGQSATVLSVSATSPYSINGHIQGTPVTFLVDYHVPWALGQWWRRAQTSSSVRC